MKGFKAKLPFFLLGAIFLVHAAFIVHYSVDIPLGDEWEALNSDQLPSGLTLSWLFKAHNEDRIVPTKFLMWALLKIDNWNLSVNQYISFAFFGVLILSFFLLKKRLAPQSSASILAWFLIFLVSAISNENHAWGVQSCIHFLLLFFLLAVYFLFDNQQKTGSLVLGSLFALGSIFSFSNGTALCAVLVVVYAFYKWDRIRAGTNKDKTRELLQSLLVIGIVGSGVAAWVVHYQRVQGHPLPILPYDYRFWDMFLNLISFGFGYHGQSALIGLICLLAVLTPLLMIWRYRSSHKESVYGLAAAILGVLAAVAVIAFGRAGFGVASSKTSRYSETAFILIPLMVFAWSIALSTRFHFEKRKTNAIWVVLWLLCLGGYSNTNNWNFKYYHHYQIIKQEGLDCVERYLRNGGEARCTCIYFADLTQKLQNAQALNLSFLKKCQAKPRH